MVDAGVGDDVARSHRVGQSRRVERVRVVPAERREQRGGRGVREADRRRLRRVGRRGFVAQRDDRGPLQDAVEGERLHAGRVDRLRLDGRIDVRDRIPGRDDRVGHDAVLAGTGRDHVLPAVHLDGDRIERGAGEHDQVPPQAVECDLLIGFVERDDRDEHPRRTRSPECDRERRHRGGRDARRARELGAGMVRDAGRPPFGRCGDPLEHAGRHHVQHDAAAGVSQVAAARIARPVVNVEGLARDHAVRGVARLDLELEAALLRLLVHQMDHEVEVSHQRLEVTLPIGCRLDQVGAGRQVLLDA